MDVSSEDNISQGMQSQWMDIDRKTAGLLFLETWDATIDASVTAMPNSQSHRSSSAVIEAFAAWLHAYNGQ